MDPSFAETLTNVNVGEALPWQQIGLFLLDCSESAVLGFRVQVATVIRIQERCYVQAYHADHVEHCQ